MKKIIIVVFLIFCITSCSDSIGKIFKTSNSIEGEYKNIGKGKMSRLKNIVIKKLKKNKYRIDMNCGSQRFLCGADFKQKFIMFYNKKTGVLTTKRYYQRLRTFFKVKKNGIIDFYTFDRKLGIYKRK